MTENERIARAYLRERIRNEQSMRSDVRRLLTRYAESLIDLLTAYLSTGRKYSWEDFTEWADELIASILNDTYLLSVDEHTQNREAILSWIGREWKGDTLEGRVRKRVRTFFKEVNAVVVAGLILGLVKRKVLNSIQTNLTHPYENPILVKARKNLNDATFVGQLHNLGYNNNAFDAPHFGYGVPISSLTALQGMTVYAVAEGWNYNDYIEHKEKAKGYRVFRGSSYPCEICDSYVGWHPADDEGSMPLYHGHCYCYVVWDDDGDTDILDR